MSSKHKAAGIRIIGGTWRGRKLPVQDISTLRPSPNRVRETLFNWLQPHIQGATCLDLFAGTGVLSFEALSRGAARASLIEQDRQLISILKQQASRLEAEELTQINHADALAWLASPATSTYDIVFLDPPFAKQLVEKSCELLVNNGYLRQNALVYIESEPGLEVETPGLLQTKQKIAGQVQYQLLKYKTNLECEK